MRNSITVSITCAVVAFSSAGISAQTAPISRTIPISFTGVVANDVTNQIVIRQPNGSYAPYTGPVPEYPYQKGDPVTITFNATVPTQSFYAAGGPYQGQVATDGIYRIALQSPFYTGGGGPGGVGNVTTPDVSGSIVAAPNSGQPTNTRMTIVYDSNADTYSLAFPNSSLGAPSSSSGPPDFISGAYAVPSYTYDATTGTLANCFGTGCGPDINSSLGTLRGGETSVGLSPISIYGTAPGTGPTSGSSTGLFSLFFSGTWNLPTFRSGGATSVPEPGMMFLFGGGALALVARRRRMKKG